MRRITYYHSLLSPWAYIGHAAFMHIAGKHGVAVDFRPVDLLRVFSATGGMALPKRHPARQRYRILELQRWRERRKLTFDLHPRFWPFNATGADSIVIAAVAAGQDPQQFQAAAYAAIWTEGRNLADDATLRSLAAATLPDSDALLRQAASPAVAALYTSNTEAAVEADAFGSPVYVLDGEVFWGQDRLDLLDEALTSGRPAYAASA